MLTLKTKNATETKALGEKIGRKLGGGETIILSGDLGAGKTCLTQGLALGLGVDPREYVTSPSFALIKEYQGRTSLCHIDLFRIQGYKEVEELGYEEYFYGEGVTVIEWPAKAGNCLPEEYLGIKLVLLGKNQRQISLNPLGQRYREILKNIL